MKKRALTALILSVIFTGLSSSVFSVKGTEQTAVLQKQYSAVTETASKDDFTYSLRNNSIFINKYIGTKTEVIIPETIDGYPVTAVLGTVFSDNHKVTYIKLPSQVKTVAPKAFNLCDMLTKIEVDESNTYFTSVNGVLYNKSMTKLVVYPCGKSDETFTVPKSVTSIGTFSFDHCFSLRKVYMYNNVTEIGANAFSFCWNLNYIHLSDNLLTLGSEALAYCRDLTKIYLPATLTSIGGNAVFGRESSNGGVEYYFTEGIYCVPGTYSYNYVKALRVPVQSTVRTITDLDTGVVIADTQNKLPTGTDLSVIPVDVSSVTSLIKNKYTSLDAFDISLKYNGSTYTPKDSLTIYFDGVNKNDVVTASRIYRIENGTASLMPKSPLDKTTGVAVSTLGRFCLASSSDFSLKGDADGDGTVTAFDAQIVLCAALGQITLTEEQKMCCKVKSGSTGPVTVGDARAILRCAAGIENL